MSGSVDCQKRLRHIPTTVIVSAKNAAAELLRTAYVTHNDISLRLWRYIIFDDMDLCSRLLT